MRYQVKDVARAVAFYTRHLGFEAGRQQLPAFASVSLGNVQIAAGIHGTTPASTILNSLDV